MSSVFYHLSATLSGLLNLTPWMLTHWGLWLSLIIIPCSKNRGKNEIVSNSGDRLHGTFLMILEHSGLSGISNKRYAIQPTCFSQHLYSILHSNPQHIRSFQIIETNFFFSKFKESFTQGTFLYTFICVFNPMFLYCVNKVLLMLAYIWLYVIKLS